MYIKITIITIFFIIPVLCNPLYAQEKKKEAAKEAPEAVEDQDDQDEKIQEMEQIIRDLQKKVEKKEKEDELENLLKEAEQLSSKQKEEEESVSKRFHSGTRQQQGLNPNISLGGDFFAGVSSTDDPAITEPGDMHYGNNGFYMREMEMAFVSPLDPFTRGKAFICVSEDGVEIEEGYIEWLNLPLNMNLKTGIFAAGFGPLNRYHDHALPQHDRPRALVNYFGLGPLGGTGLASNFLLPRLLWANSSILDFSVIRGGNDISFTSQGKYNLLYIAKWNNYYDLSDNSYLEYNISGVTGKNDTEEEYNSYVGSVGLTYKWAPGDRSKYRTLEWKTEFLYGYREGLSGDEESKGFYSSIQNKLGSRFWIAGRVGYSELPYDNSRYDLDYTLCLDFWQSEFVLLRLQYQYNQRDYNYLNNEGVVANLPSDHSFLVQICWAMGPHKHEAY